MNNNDHMKIIYMQFVLIVMLIIAVTWPEITCNFDWPDVGVAGDME